MCQEKSREVFQVSAEKSRIALSGTIGAEASGALCDAYASAEPAPEITLDLSGVEHIDIPGINELIKLVLRARAHGRILLAEGLGSELADIFHATCIDEAFLVKAGPSGAGGSSYDKARASAWARPVERLSLRDVPEGAINLNVDGLRVSGPIQGFGQLWEKTFRVRLAGVDASPREVIKVFKENFVGLQPPQNRFFPTSAGLAPGAVVLINAHTPAGLICTGVWVVYADETAFTLMTPQGHPESGWVSFSAHEEDGCTVAQVAAFARTNDPLFEVGFRLMGSREHERIWTQVLESLAAHFGVPGWVRMQKACVGPDLQWDRVHNVFYNAQIRTMLTSFKRAFF